MAEEAWPRPGYTSRPGLGDDAVYAVSCLPVVLELEELLDKDTCSVARVLLLGCVPAVRELPLLPVVPVPDDPEVSRAAGTMPNATSVMLPSLHAAAVCN